MDHKEFRKIGTQMIDWITEYKDNPNKWDVTSKEEPGYLAKVLPKNAPQDPEKFDEIWEDFKTTIMKGVVHWNHPQFHGYFPSGNAYENVIADSINAAIGSNCFSWVCNPVGSELETIVLDWFARAIGLPQSFQSDNSKFIGGGCFQGSASDASMVAALAARERTIKAMRGDDQEDRHDSTYLPELVVYASKEAHSSIEKACKMALIQLRALDTDEFGNMQGATVEAAIKEDLARGLTPCMVVVTLGTTGLVSFDNLKDITKVVRGVRVKIPIWVHVDAAYAGSTFICPEYRHYNEGIEEVDSFMTNPNKLLLGAFDMTCFFVRDVKTFQKSLVINPLYLKNNYTNPRQIDYRHFSSPLSRRFRALKLWFLMRSYGVEGLQSYVRNIIRSATHFRKLAQKDSRFEVFHPQKLGLIAFRYKDKTSDVTPSNDRTSTLITNLYSGKKIYLVPTKFAGKIWVRVGINYQNASEQHIERSWKIISDEADKMPKVLPKPDPRMYSFCKKVTKEEYARFRKGHRLVDCATPVYYVDGKEDLVEYP